MSLPIFFRRTARNEYVEAAVRVVLDRISEQPEFYAKVFEDVREGLVEGYPYCVYYRVETDHIQIIAVFHTARDPAVWKKRAT